MGISDFENAKEIADKMQASEGEKINNPLGTNQVYSPLDDDIINDFNKGVDLMSDYGNHHIYKKKD